ncbi:MAG: ion transporter [Bacteroidota bacterium]
MSRSTKGKVHILLHPELGNSKWDKIINAFILSLIILNVAAVSLETVPSIYDPNKQFFHVFDTMSVIIFSVEYILRVWSCNHDPRYAHSIRGRLRYMLSPGALIDLAAILPFYIHVVVGLDLRVLRILRLLRFLRLFRLTAYMRSARIVLNVFKSRANQLQLSLMLIVIFVTLSGCIVYFVEHPAQPEVFTTIPNSIYWAVITVTSVGYGDIVPITTAGKIMTTTISILGLGVYALPAGIVTAGFLEEMRSHKKLKNKYCPHCGEELPRD